MAEPPARGAGVANEAVGPFDTCQLRTCGEAMNFPSWPRAKLALFLLVLAACTPSPGPQAHASPSIPVKSFAGGCAGTVLTDAIPPAWAQGGWTRPQGPWTVPWAIGTGGDAVAYVFATQLVAGSSPRADGSTNKVLWVVRDAPTGFNVEAHPLGADRPVIPVAAGPSTVDLPTAGCWTFHLTWSRSAQPAGSTINLEVLPQGSLP